MRKIITKKEPMFIESLNYIKDSKKYIFLIIFSFVASFLIGLAFSDSFGFLDPLLEEFVKETDGLGTFGMIWFIFTNNLFSSFFGLVLGIFLGVFSLFNALLNGLVVGYVYSKASLIGGYGIFWQLLPHGIFELPAIFISLGLGVKLGMFVFANEKKKTFFYRLKKSVKTFFVIVVPLLAVAAVIEGILITLT